MQRSALSWLIVFVALGCSAADSSGPQVAGGSGGSGATSSSSGDLGVGGAFTSVGSSGSSGGSSGGNCSEAAKLIYVLSDANVLYSFRPDQKQFTEIGPLGCQTSLQPNSMAVDRDAVAWVNYVHEEGPGGVATSGAIYKVSTKDASCEPTLIDLDAGWYRLGMGFSTDAVGGSSETLFVAGTGLTASGTSADLGKLDFGAMTVTPIGEYSGTLAGRSAELTGTGDARLYGFFRTKPVQVAEIDKATAAIKSARSLSEVQTPFAWAFSFWGGDFYLYTAPADDMVTSTVSRYHPADDSIEPTYMTNIGFRIVGAGVSTCAPLEPPR
jgi:hypothetical protein